MRGGGNVGRGGVLGGGELWEEEGECWGGVAGGATSTGLLLPSALSHDLGAAMAPGSRGVTSRRQRRRWWFFPSRWVPLLTQLFDFTPVYEILLNPDLL